MIPSKIKTKITPRKPGRPEATALNVRDVLLDNALRLFAIQGIAHTNLRKIAIESHTTPAMIHYHFGGKDGLIKAVMDERVRALVTGMQNGMIDKTLSAKHVLAELMKGFIRLAGINPWVPKLVLREVYSEHGALRDTFVENFGHEMSRMLLGLIKRAQQEGALKKELDARATAYAFLSLAIYPVLSSPVIPMVLGLPHDTESMLNQASRNFDIFMMGVSTQ
jgi:TetR/AcrR family transcriptional regulator